MFGWTSWELLARARQAARARDWPAASQAYAAYLRRRPKRASAWVQLGHAYKEQRDFAGARKAYQWALALDAKNADNWLQLGHILKLQGERAAAIDAYASAAELEPQLAPAAEELIAMGERDRVPEACFIHQQEGPRGSPAQTELDATMGDALDEARRPGSFPPSRYNAYRQQLSVPKPPWRVDSGDLIEVLLDGRDAVSADVRATLSSLLDQVHEQWRATVLVPAAMLDHSVASLAQLDERILFVGGKRPEGSDVAGGLQLLLSAGVVLDRQALGWFAFVARRTGCVAAYCDHDRSVDTWHGGRSFEAPSFQPMCDPIWFAEAGAESAPAVVLIDGVRLNWPHDNASAAARRQLLLAAAGMGGVAHLPLLLASIKALPPEAETALPDPVSDTAPSSLPAPQILSAPRSEMRRPDRIQVIIQTRDESQLLDVCVSSLRKRATRPDLLDISIVDNRSVQPATRRLLDRMRGENVQVSALDAPFNWSHANNLAAAGGEAPLLLFLNNDTEMLSDGWDKALRKALAEPDVGIVGALLLYPDRTIQHAGMIFGMGAGGPVHEGVGRSGADAGPAGRWSTPRSASAVTGAFLAMRRDAFDQIGRFDAVGLSIAFNDVDICLRVRAAGLRVLQTPEISLIHYESKTRGMNVTRSRIAWDLEELALLRRRWGTALFSDPGYNPHWTRYGQPFDGYRFPSLREVVRHIDRSAKSQPWNPSAGDDARDLVWW